MQEGNGLHSSRYWIDRAEEARVRSGQMHDADARETMARIAATYDRMAERAAQREASAPVDTNRKTG
jgi:hypothetical protein